MSIRRNDDRYSYRSLELPSGRAEVWLEHAGERIIFHTVQPNGSGSGNWLRCSVDACLGEAVSHERTCLRHTTPSARAQYLGALSGSDRALSLQGVSIDSELLDAILNSPVVSEKTMLVPVFLTGANVGCRVDFSNWEFARYFGMAGAIFHDAADFHGSVFRQQLGARFTDFRGGPGYFSGSTFERDVDLSFAHSERQTIGIESCTFAEGVTAEGIVGAISLQKSSCSGNLNLTGSAAVILLNDLLLTGSLDMAGCRCMTFQGARLRADAARFLGPMEVQGNCMLADARFSERIRIEVTSKQLDLSGARFDRGGSIQANGEQILLERVSTGSALGVSGGRGSQPKPAVLSIQNADAGAMSFSNVDMSRCLFYGANDLENIRIEATVSLAKSPNKWWLSNRGCVADEFAWRAHAGGRHGRGWTLPGTRIELVSSDDDATDVYLPELDASLVASVYRGLRRSFEAKGNEPGAADFYYGEMEMRRKAGSTQFPERFILWLY